MRYTIIHRPQDTGREPYVNGIRNNLVGWKEVHIKPTDGSNADDLNDALEAWENPKVNYNAKLGQLGRWFTFLDHVSDSFWLNSPILALEDDAILDAEFKSRFEDLTEDVPEDADFFSLFIPRNRVREVYVNTPGRGREINPVYDIGHDTIVRAHQPYGGVAMVIYPSLYDKMSELLYEEGITAQFDDVLYDKAQRRQLNGYSIVPDLDDLVWIQAGIPSTVHETKEF